MSRARRLLRALRHPSRVPARWRERRLRKALERDRRAHRHLLPQRPDAALDVQVLGEGADGYGLLLDQLGPTSVLVSAGVGNDIGFELGLIAATGGAVHAFDPTSASRSYVARLAPPGLRFVQAALAGEDGWLELFEIREGSPDYHPRTVFSLASARNARRQSERVPARSLPSLCAELGWTRVDLLKLDIEGAEYAVLESLAAAECWPTQLALEFHPSLLNMARLGRLEGARGWEETADWIGRLRDVGYRVVHVSPRGTELTLARDAA